MNWYLLATEPTDSDVVQRVRIVAGPYSQVEAFDAATNRLRHTREGVRIMVVEYDPRFGLR